MNTTTLKNILKNHELWLKDDNQGNQADLSGADLRFANLNQANLSKTYLNEANLSGADLSGADLRFTKGILYTSFDPRGWVLISWKYNNQIGFTAGCRSFSNKDEAIAHWGGKNYIDKQRGEMYIETIEFHLKQWEKKGE